MDKWNDKKPAGIKKHRNVHREPNKRFRDPAHFVLRWNPGWAVVHGVVNGEFSAWVEKGGFVVDLHNDVRMPKEQYYKVFKVKPIKRFTKSELREALDLWRTYGPFPEYGAA